MPDVTVATGMKLHYERHGRDRGIPVLFIRGTGSAGDRWAPQVEAYAERYPCVVFDNRGAGRSDVPPGPYTMADLASDALGLLDALGIGRVHVSGLSLGGAVALHLALAAPRRVATLQLHAAWARTRGRAEWYFRLGRRLVELGGPDLYYDAMALLLLSPRRFDSEQTRTTIARMKASASPVGLPAQLAASLGHDVLARLEEIAAPTLVTVGELDMVLPPGYSEELRDGIAGARLVVFPGGSHLFCAEDPETFNRVTLDWLASVARDR